MIAIIDYGVGNLGSVEKAFKFLGYNAAISSDKKFIENSDAVVLPGVGAFTDAMCEIKKRDFDKLIKGIIDYGKPFLGICLGLQLLFEYSEEGGSCEGLGILKGTIKKIPRKSNLKVPHVGWNNLHIVNNNELFKGISASPYVYFVHSYYLKASNREDVIAKTMYGIEIDAAVNRKNIYAVQFHPEKSGTVGLKILDNFGRMI